MIVFFFKQKTAYEMRISDWSSDVCSSDLYRQCQGPCRPDPADRAGQGRTRRGQGTDNAGGAARGRERRRQPPHAVRRGGARAVHAGRDVGGAGGGVRAPRGGRSAEHTYEIQSLMRNSYGVYCVTKKRENKK